MALRPQPAQTSEFCIPIVTESIFTVSVPLARTCGRNAAKPTVSPFVGGIGPENSPVVAPIVGNGAEVFSTTPAAPSISGGDSVPTTSCRDVARGVTVFVIRVDSSDDGPDCTELMSN